VHINYLGIAEGSIHYGSGNNAEHAKEDGIRIKLKHAVDNPVQSPGKELL